MSSPSPYPSKFFSFLTCLALSRKAKSAYSYIWDTTLHASRLDSLKSVRFLSLEKRCFGDACSIPFFCWCPTYAVMEMQTCCLILLNVFTHAWICILHSSLDQWKWPACPLRYPIIQRAEMNVYKTLAWDYIFLKLPRAHCRACSSAFFEVETTLRFFPTEILINCVLVLTRARCTAFRESRPGAGAPAALRGSCLHGNTWLGTCAQHCSSGAETLWLPRARRPSYSRYRIAPTLL